jgi:hypothetical protein
MHVWDWKWKHTALLVLFCGMALACFGCTFNPAVYYKSVSTGAVASNAAYLALKTADAEKTAQIVAEAPSAPAKAKTDKLTWNAIFDKALKSLDVHRDVVIGALREGPPVKGLIANPKSYEKWLTALTVAAAAVGLALSDAGINWQQILTGGN